MAPARGRGPAVLAIDEGTTGVTALVLDERRRVLGRAYREIACQYPRPGWVEQDPLEVLRATIAVGRAALRSSRLANRDLAAIGIANQRETTVLWDRRTGKPVAPAIVWQDRRTATRCAALAGSADLVRQRTGLIVDPYFCATKLEWLLDRRDLRRRAQAGSLAFGTIDAWLAWNLTGRHVTDPTNASRTMLWDIHKGAWDEELLDLFRIPAAVLPDVVPSSHAIGACTAFSARGRRASGTASAVPIAALVGAQQSALLGAGCQREGQAKNTYGTGCFLLQHTGRRAVASRHGLLTTRAASLDGAPRFALEGSVFTAGAAIQWLRDQLGMVAAAPEVDRLAAQVEDSGGVVVVPAFAGLGAPHWDPEARGAILGLTGGSDRRHLAHAVLESIALQSADLVAAMELDSGRRMRELRVDGGATRSRVLLQMQADLLGRVVVRPANVETTALGAGMLAGLATDVWSRGELQRPSQGELRVAPRMGAAERRRRLARWHAAVAAVRSYRPDQLPLKSATRFST